MSIIPRPPNATTGTQACAACKYQRRKCTPDCTLAPYFPPDRQRQFLNAHKLFGVSNILKIIRNLDPLQKDEAMRTMIIQADIRANDPVGGCYRIIHELQCQIERDKAELDLVLHQLAICRAQAHHQIQMQEAAIHGQAMNPDPLSTYNPMHQHLPSVGQDYIVQENHHQFLNQWAMQEPNSNRIDLEASSSSSSLHVKEAFINDCEDIKPLLGMFDERQSSLAFDSKDSMNCSDKPMLKEEETGSLLLKDEETNSMQHVQEHDLKGAASLFTLTNCNS